MLIWHVLRRILNVTHQGAAYDTVSIKFPFVQLMHVCTVTVWSRVSHVSALQ